MTLATHSNQPVAFPLGQTLSARLPLVRPDPLDADVSLAVITGWQHLHIRGASAEAAVSAAYDVEPMAINAVAIQSDGFLVRLRRDEFVLLTNDVTGVM